MGLNLASMLGAMIEKNNQENGDKWVFIHQSDISRSESRLANISEAANEEPARGVYLQTVHGQVSTSLGPTNAWD